MSLPIDSPARFRGEVRTTAVLAAPLVVGHVSTGLIGFVDAVLAGHHGTTTLAAVSVGTALFWLPMMIPMGTLMALPPSVSQLAGAGRHGEIGRLDRAAPQERRRPAGGLCLRGKTGADNQKRQGGARRMRERHPGSMLRRIPRHGLHTTRRGTIVRGNALQSQIASAVAGFTSISRPRRASEPNDCLAAPNRLARHGIPDRSSPLRDATRHRPAKTDFG